VGTILRLQLPGDALGLFSVQEEKLFHLSIGREQVGYLVFQHPARDDAQGGHGWFGSKASRLYQDILFETPYSESCRLKGLIDRISCSAQSAELNQKGISPCGICIKVCPVGEDRKLFGREDGSIYSQRDKHPAEHRAWEHVRRYGGCDLQNE